MTATPVPPPAGSPFAANAPGASAARGLGRSAYAKLKEDPDRVLIFDTTLRDGEQSPGASMNQEEKLRIALLLEEMGADIIEAGFPAASNGDFEAVRQISRTLTRSTVAALARTRESDIRRAAEALSDDQGRMMPNRRIHTFLATSPLHREYKLRMSREEVLDTITASVSLARSLTDDVEWSAEDGGRTEDDFLARAVETAIRAGATTINIPDTVGYTVPDEFGAKIRRLIEAVPDSDKAIFSVHCHNDLGLAVANSLAGVLAGARQIECTINGIGERAGNTALEEVVMAIRTRRDQLPFWTGITSEYITRASHLVSTVTGFPVQPNKAIVGANAFAHESGIHQDGMLKHAGTYEIMTPESVGLNKSSLVLGKLSGRNAFRARLAELGYTLSDNQLNDAFQRFKDLADRKRELYDEDLVALVDDEVGRDHTRIRLVSLRVVAGTEGPQQATLSLDVDGVVETVTAQGNGPVDAVFNAIQALVPHDAVLQLYQVHAVTAGTDAQAEVTVRLSENGRTVNGQGADADTLVSSARAYLHALNKLLQKRERGRDQAAGAGDLRRA